MSTDGPLAGVRVVDLSWVLAGPVVGRLMADAGADVIKVESRQRLDNTRLGRALPSTEEGAEPTDRVPLFHALNAGKRSVAVDLRSPGAAGVVKRLVAVSDVVVENFAPGVLDRLGLGYESLCAANPSVILLSMSGTGQQGPLSDVPAYAPTVSSLAGLESLVGYPGEPPMGMIGANFADSLGGLYGVHAVLAALWAREELGVGQHIDYSEMDGVCTMLAEPLMDYFLNGRVAVPTGNSSRDGAPYGVFPAAGDDQWLAMAVVSDQDWAAFSVATGGEPWTADPSYATADGRRQQEAELHDSIARYTRAHPRDEIVERLRRHGVPASPVYEVGEWVNDPYHRSRGLLAEVDGLPGGGEVTVYGSPWQLSATPVGPRGPGPALGQHTRQVLRTVAEISDAEIDELTASGVVA